MEMDAKEVMITVMAMVGTVLIFVFALCVCGLALGMFIEHLIR